MISVAAFSSSFIEGSIFFDRFIFVKKAHACPLVSSNKFIGYLFM
ncbi:hypothetical protein LLB_2295 [Legionella longbeachae D-4968]|nr:hypothetical protein LLB_2295 [Legionella longbeachae D-4968]